MEPEREIGLAVVLVGIGEALVVEEPVDRVRAIVAGEFVGRLRAGAPARPGDYGFFTAVSVSSASAFTLSAALTKHSNMRS